MKKFILILPVFVFMLFGFNFANAETTPEVSCVINGNLKMGSVGAEVTCLQKSLSVTADGKFGKGTKSALIAWQKSFKLKTDGVFGPKSRALWVTNGSVAGNTLKIEITSPAVLPNAQLNTSYTFTPLATGGTKIYSTDNYNWSVSSGALPPGLDLVEGIFINGVPREMGTYSFSLKALNGTNSATKEFTLKVDAAAPSTGAN